MVAVFSSGRPFDVAVDADGNVYVSTSLGIRRVDGEVGIGTVLGSAATTPERQVRPSDALLALDRHGNLYLCRQRADVVVHSALPVAGRG